MIYDTENDDDGYDNDDDDGKSFTSRPDFADGNFYGDNGDNDRDNGDSKFYFFLFSNSGQTLLMASVIMTMMRETYFLFLQIQGRLC